MISGLDSTGKGNKRCTQPEIYKELIQTQKLLVTLIYTLINLFNL
jgi:hypothetical protein